MEPTPGPWYLRTNSHRNCDGTSWGWLDTNQAGNQRPPQGVHVTWSAGQTSQANARLVVAAHDLLKAGKTALDCLEDIFGKEKIDSEAINQLRAAIQKATGAKS